MRPELGDVHTTQRELMRAAGYAACFENALLRAARERRVRLEGSAVTAGVRFGRMGNGRFNLQVELAVSPAGVDEAEAAALARAAHAEICPYSRATCGNIDVKVSVAWRPPTAGAAARSGRSS